MNNEENKITSSEEISESKNVSSSGNAGGGFIGWWNGLKSGVKAAIIAGAACVVIIPIIIIILLSGAGSGTNNGETPDNGAENNGNENTGYTVTAVTEDGLPVRGVKVNVVTASGMQMPFTTDSEGKATIALNGATSVTVTEVPSGYTYSKLGVEQSFDANGELKVTISEIPPYVVYVVDEDGNPVAGATIKVCDDSNLCLKPATTGADGKATFNYVEGNFHAAINGADALPDGYTVDDIDETYDFVDNETTITLIKIVD